MKMILLCLIIAMKFIASLAWQFPDSEFLNAFIAKHERNFMTIYTPENSVTGWVNWHRTSRLRYEFST